MTTVKDIYDYIDSFAPFNTAEEYDNVGILAGSPQQKVLRAVVALDITADVVEEARNVGAELVISHHPIIFNPLKRIQEGSAVYKLVQSGISAICAHTNLDKSSVFGVNTELAKAVGLKDCKLSGKSDILFTAETIMPVTSDSFALSVKEKLGGGIAYTRRDGNIKKVGLCSGAGGSEIYPAAAEGCDAFITGEMKHHEIIFANENNISLYVLGHYKSEDVVISPLAKKLSERFDDVEFLKSKTFTDGVRFV